MWQLIINGPGYYQTSYDLPDGTTTVGRADENDIVLSGDLVSRRHARLHASGGQLRVEDLGSRNGSKLNGNPLHGSAQVRAGDVLAVGENTLAIRQARAAEEAQTEVVDLGAGGVKRFGSGTDIGQAVILAKDVRESSLLRALDNVTPFDFSGAPFEEPEPSPAQSIAVPSLLLLYRVAESLSTSGTLERFLEDTIDRLIERVNATTAVVLLRHRSGVLVPQTVRHRGTLQHGEVPVSDAIVDAALSGGQALAVADAHDDRRFAARESVILYGIDQVLCVPIGQGEPFAGVLYLNRQGGRAAEVEALLDLCSAVAHLIATGVEKFQLKERAPRDDRLRQALERVHPPSVSDRRLEELERAGKQTELEERTATVLFAEIEGLTALAEKLPPERVMELLNELRRQASRIFFSYEGMADPFGGAVLGVFGAPFGRAGDGQRAVRAALTLKAEWQRAMARRPLRERAELRLGLHTGKLLSGVVGTDSRLDVAAIGEPVEVASSLAATAEGGQVLITGKTLAAVGARFEVTPLGERALTPKLRAAVFEVLEEDIGTNTNPGVR